MRIGQFFSLQQGRVGQYLSPRVLVVRMPFRPSAGDVCYFGFDRLNQAQKFAHYLATMGCNFQLRRSQSMPQPYEVRLVGHRDLARTLAYWDRLDHQQTATPQPTVRPTQVTPAASVTAPIAA